MRLFVEFYSILSLSYSFSAIYILPMPFFILFYVLVFLIYCTSLGGIGTMWSVSPCVGVSLCVDVRVCRVSSCTWRVGALVSRGLASGVWGCAVQCLPRFFCYIFVHVVCSQILFNVVLLSYFCRLRPPQVGLALIGFFLNVFFLFNVSLIKSLRLFEPCSFPFSNIELIYLDVVWNCVMLNVP